MRPSRWLTLAGVVLIGCSSTSSSGPSTYSPADLATAPELGGRRPPTTLGPATTMALPAVQTSAATTSSTSTTLAPATTSTTTLAPTTTVPGQVLPTGSSPAPGNSVYAHAGVGDLSPAVAGDLAYVYVPSNVDGSVTVIDQATHQIVDHFQAGKLVQHVVPSWDLTTLYATASNSNRLVPIDPKTGKPGLPIPVGAPYNLYFSPDGTQAIVMGERINRIEVYDPHTWQLIRAVPTGDCNGLNHADWSADESFFLATCEFSGSILKVDTATTTIVGRITLPHMSMPQDLRLVPDGSKFYVADMNHAGIWVIDGQGTQVIGSFLTGVGAHGIYPSRDGRYMYVTNRGRDRGKGTGRSRPGEGSISVVDWTADRVVTAWPIPGGGSPDMGGVSADGAQLWISGRYDSVVYVFDTATGALIDKIKVPPGPHGLAVFPQPGRFSLGHTGNYR